MNSKRAVINYDFLMAQIMMAQIFNGKLLRTEVRSVFVSYLILVCSDNQFVQ